MGSQPSIAGKAAAIRIRGARQNNLKNLDLDIKLNSLTVITGVSGSGKSSLAFDTLYSEGQRLYVETFSAYTRQFLDRMDKPAVDKIEGIPPAIAIDQTNPVRTSRSTVGTMTELNDHLKLLFARASKLFCRSCGREVIRDTPESVAAHLERIGGDRRLAVTFPVKAAGHLSDESVGALVQSLGYRGIFRRIGDVCHVIQDRVRYPGVAADRLMEDLEQALSHGHGRLSVWEIDEEDAPTAEHRFSSDLHCAACDIHYSDPIPNLFSFNSPIGACETCRGFGRVIGIDYALVIPDGSKTLLEGAVKPWQSKSYAECQRDMTEFARKRSIRLDVPWDQLTDGERAWVIDGEGDWDDGKWYGASRFFEWLEGRSYRMHIRVLLSRYRAYHTCPDCGGARLKPDPLLWRMGPEGGRNIRELTLIPIDQLGLFFSQASADEATEQLLEEIRRRIGYLVDVGLGYLNLDRQSRTLSGGEVQRVNLTTALGTSLVNALFVLDEPSIGLHPRDVNRMIGVLHRLRDSGNTIVVVEHDPAVIAAADHIIDLGPGAGAHGGQIVFKGSPSGILTSKRSVTGAYLSGRRSTRAEISRSAARQSMSPDEIVIRGASENNLKNIEVQLPLHQIVGLTGVSGSGKSTLMEDVLYRALRRHLGVPTEQPGTHEEIVGAELVDEVVLVDQSAIGKSARSNPASYVGAFDAIRKVFADQPLSKERGYTTGTFSFNSPKGQCPTCKGSGFEHIEMQFLSDVYLRCPDCGGNRFRSEVLEVRLPAGTECVDGVTARCYSIAEVLEMTVDQAAEFFADHTKVIRGLSPLRQVGLGYVSLGQPVPTLSGGEAQRLKLASRLATTTKDGQHTLFLFDEPTTGLHFQDIATLLAAFASLVSAGHSILVIEHNLDVIRAADWVIDLGPEGGEAGGQVVFAGTPEQLARTATHTGVALRQSGATAQPPEVAESAPEIRRAVDSIEVRGAREHNLKNIDLLIPHNKFTVLTGVSGSGKSTIAFDIVFAEGQRRYLESLNAYARQFVQPASRAEMDGAVGIPPSVAIEQRTSRGGQKSTVATSTEIYQYLRLLYAKMGTQYCPDCDVPIQSQTRAAIESSIQNEYQDRSIFILAPLILARKGYYTDLAKRLNRQGHDYLRVDGEMTPTDDWPRLDRYKEHNIELPFGPIVLDSSSQSDSVSTVVHQAIDQALEQGNGVIYVLDNEPTADGEQAPRTYSTRYACPKCARSFDELDPRLFSYNSSHGWCPDCLGTGLDLSSSDRTEIQEAVVWDGLAASSQVCVSCSGGRLRPEARAVRFRDRSIVEFTAMSIQDAHKAVSELRLTDREQAIGRDIVTEMANRLSFLTEVGLSYLTLDRSAPTLSGGEAQRIRLASQLGSNLRGVCYILDEPTIGLHPRDNQMLLSVLRRLTDKGNTVVVVEHDEETIRAADYIVDLGPGGGVGGGSVIAAGPLHSLLKHPSSVTAAYLRNERARPGVAEPRTNPASDGGVHNGDALRIVGAKAHNLRDIDVAIPLRQLVSVTGVSGSGKSSLVRDVLFETVHEAVAASRGKRGRDRRNNGVCREIRGIEHIERVLEVDQTPIGKTPRSTPATYIGVWDEVRRLFASLPESRMRGYTASRFSFNTVGGRCEVCGGQGVQRIEMSFLPDVTVICEQCNGARYDEETLSVEFKGKTIADVLAMSVEEAVEFFSAQPKIFGALRLLDEVGLGYLTLGQRSPTLSGGEAQRIKLVAELARSTATAARLTRKEIRSGGGVGEPALPSALYVLDEPTVGLHMADVDQLITVLRRLVDTGATVVVIEHNLDLIAASDWVIDLGPEGGDGGGRIVAEGPVQSIVAERASYTGAFLAKRFAR